MASFRFLIHPERLAIARLEPRAALPEWARGAFVSSTRTPGELSIVCAQRNVPLQVAQEREKLGLFIEGTVSMTAVGIIASLSRALADAKVPIFVIATYDTDWILVGAQHLDATRAALESLGHTVSGELPPS
ncbi:MAG: ACT domain-containing protein [Planctomycetota bacterium]